MRHTDSHPVPNRKGYLHTADIETFYVRYPVDDVDGGLGG